MTIKEAQQVVREAYQNKTFDKGEFKIKFKDEQTSDNFYVAFAVLVNYRPDLVEQEEPPQWFKNWHKDNYKPKNAFLEVSGNTYGNQKVNVTKDIPDKVTLGDYCGMLNDNFKSWETQWK